MIQRGEQMKIFRNLILAVGFSLFISSNCLAEEAGTSDFFPILNLKATYPQSISLEIGLSRQYSKSQHSNDSIGPFISYEPGINGQKVHLGIAYTYFDSPIPFTDKMIIAKLSASYYQTWRDSSGFNSGVNMYGIEVSASYNMFVLVGGLYFNQDNNQYAGSVGVGFGL